MVKIFIFIIFFVLGIFSCSPSFDDDTIATIGRQKISKSLFHKQIPEISFSSLDDPLKLDKVEEFLKNLLVERDIKKMQLENNSEIKKEMSLWSKRTLAGLLFDKKILNKVFPEDSLKKIYNDYKIERNISVIVLPYVKVKTEKIPDKNQARILANDIYRRSKIENFRYLQDTYSKIKANPNEKYSHWTKLFSGINSVDRELWKYKVGQVTKPIDDGQSYRIIKINSDKENTKIPDYKYQKDMLIKQVVDLWKKPLQDYFLFHTDSLLHNAGFHLDQNKVEDFSKDLEMIIQNNNIIEALEKSNFDEKIGRYNNIFLDRKWFVDELKQEENIFGYQLADVKMSYGFIRGLISSKVNYDAAIKMGIQNSPNYLNKYEEELNTRIRNFYEINIYKKGLELKNEELLDYYEKNKKGFSVPPKIFAQWIWFDDYGIAWSQYKKIEQNNYSFDELFNIIKDKNTRKTGATKGFISSTSSTDPFNDLFELENGLVSKPFLRGNKFYIIKVIEKIEPQVRSFEEVRSQIYMRLSKKYKKRNDIIARKALFEKYNVSINVDLIQS